MGLLIEQKIIHKIIKFLIERDLPRARRNYIDFFFNGLMR